MNTESREGLEWGLSRLHSGSYDGGYNGTCYDCPFASPPLDRSGREVPFREVANDPTEAYYRCSLPTRAEDQRLSWGEYAPCTQDEWTGWLKGLTDKLLPTTGETLRLWVVHEANGDPTTWGDWTEPCLVVAAGAEEARLLAGATEHDAVAEIDMRVARVLMQMPEPSMGADL